MYYENKQTEHKQTSPPNQPTNQPTTTNRKSTFSFLSLYLPASFSLSASFPIFSLSVMLQSCPPAYLTHTFRRRMKQMLISSCPQSPQIGSSEFTNRIEEGSLNVPRKPLNSDCVTRVAERISSGRSPSLPPPM